MMRSGKQIQAEINARSQYLSIDQIIRDNKRLRGEAAYYRKALTIILKNFDLKVFARGDYREIAAMLALNTCTAQKALNKQQLESNDPAEAGSASGEVLVEDRDSESLTQAKDNAASTPAQVLTPSPPPHQLGTGNDT
jgi:hypothetical protein